MRRLLAAVAVFMLPALPATGQETVEISTLLALPDEYDQQVVTIRGEIVGDYGDRGDVVWVQVNDDAYVDQPLATTGRLAGTNTGLSVRLTGGVPHSFGAPGAHGVRGPIVEVTGFFRDLDPALGGLTFVEATDVLLISPSESLPEPGLDPVAATLGTILTAAGLLALAHRRNLLPSSERSK